MLIKKIDLNKPNKNLIKLASQILSKNGLVVYPTDTAYGLGVNALKVSTINKLYEAKNRSFDKPTHIIVSNIQMMEKVSYVNEYARILYNSFLPGPLTIILKKKNIIPDILTGGINTIGIRIPNCTVTKLLSKDLSFPYTTPSANKSGDKTPYSINEALSSLGKNDIDLALDAGELPKTQPSTIIDVSHANIKILREGPLSKSNIEKILKTKIL